MPFLAKRLYFIYNMHMVVDERLTTYIHSLEKDLSPFFEDLRKYAKENDVPIIRRETESFLRVLLKINMSKKEELRILEIGTAIGYSALFFEDEVPCAKIDTIENYEPRLKQARENLKGHSNINLIEGDAVQEIKNLDDIYDFIFLDAAKAQYIVMLPDLKRLMNKGAILVADNVLQEGDLIESRFVTERRQRTIHERMREFLYEIKHDKELESTILTVGDGISISIKK